MSADVEPEVEAPLQNQQSQQDRAAATSDSDDEWEFEYDNTQTEDFYVTLDLTTLVPPQKRKRKRNPTPETDPSPYTQFDASTINTPPQPDDQLKIHDLHTDNPIIFYQGQIFSCQWATTLGTDLLFAKPDPPQEPPQPTTPTPTPTPTPARNASHLEPTPTTVASTARAQPPSAATPPKTTTIRLLAAPATLTYKHPHPTNNIDNPPEGPDKRTAAHTQARRAKQTVFLHRLAQAKRAKGETDPVPMWTNKPNHQPALEASTVATATATVAGTPTPATMGADNDVGGDDGDGDGDDDGDGDGDGDANELRQEATREQADEARKTRKNVLRRRRRWRKRIDGALAATGHAARGNDDDDGAEGQAGEDVAGN